MTLDEAVSRLEQLGSDQDPIFYEGRETTAQDLLGKLPPGRVVERMRIGYFARSGDGMVRVQRGTFRGMIRDRKRRAYPSMTCGCTHVWEAR